MMLTPPRFVLHYERGFRHAQARRHPWMPSTAAWTNAYINGFTAGRAGGSA